MAHSRIPRDTPQPRRAWPGFVLATVLQLGIGFVAYHSIDGLVEAATARREAREVVECLTRILSLLKDAETGQRGFLLAGEDAYLAPHREALAKLPAEFDLARRLVDRSPELHDGLMRAESLARERLGVIDRTIQARKQGLEASLAIVRTHQGKRTMDSLRETIDRMLRTQEARVEKLHGRVQAAANMARFAIPLTSLVAIACMLGAGVALQRTLLRRTQLTEALVRLDADRVMAIEQRQLFADVVEEVQIGLVVWHWAGGEGPDAFTLKYANEAALRLVNLDTSSPGQTMAQALPGTRDAGHVEIISTYTAVARGEGSRVLDDVKYEDPDRPRAVYSVKAFALPGSHLGIAFEDVTRRREGENAVRQFNVELEGRVSERTRELEESNRQLVHQTRENEMFVFSVSHDLRSPLVNLQGFAHELELSAQDLRGVLEEPRIPGDLRQRATEYLDQNVRESIGFIKAAVTRLSGIVDSLLRLSRAGRVTYRRERVDLDPILARIRASLDGTISRQGARVTVAGLPAALADPNGVEQIFANLLGNALKYLDPARPGHVEVGYAGESPAAGSGRPMRTYFVRDNGRGIPLELHGKVFEAFQRAHPDVKEGEGLGLALVHRVVERMGGTIRVESEVSTGSTFFVSLPSPD